MIAPLFAAAGIAASPVLAAISAACVAYEAVKQISVQDAFADSAKSAKPSGIDDFAHMP